MSKREKIEGFSLHIYRNLIAQKKAKENALTRKLVKGNII